MADGQIFDFTINLGNVITIGGVVVVVAIALTRLQGKQQEHTKDIKALVDGLGTLSLKLDKIGDILIVQTAVEGRMNIMDERITSQGRRVDETMKRVNAILDGEYVVKDKT